MPRGRPKKVVAVEAKADESKASNPEPIKTVENPVVAPVPVAVQERAEKFSEKALGPDEQRIKESRSALLQPLPAGQNFFETPDGEIIIGEADREQVWSRRMNGGRGGWVNPRR